MKAIWTALLLMFLGWALSAAGAEKKSWARIVTKGNQVLEQVELISVEENGIWVFDRRQSQRVFLAGSKMPDWLVEEMKPAVQEVRRQKQAERERMNRDETEGKALPAGLGGWLYVFDKWFKVEQVVDENPLEIRIRTPEGPKIFRLQFLTPEAQKRWAYDPKLAEAWKTMSEAERAKVKVEWLVRKTAAEQEMRAALKLSPP
ncbi:MAG: hypothetical protein KDK99_18555 [Verrucomicrobiales bacterium]|nr:hypothetical protein [Verrucomicrobiales bacterium]